MKDTKFDYTRKDLQKVAEQINNREAVFIYHEINKKKQRIAFLPEDIESLVGSAAAAKKNLELTLKYLQKDFTSLEVYIIFKHFCNKQDQGEIYIPKYKIELTERLLKKAKAK